MNESSDSVQIEQRILIAKIITAAFIFTALISTTIGWFTAEIAGGEFISDPTVPSSVFGYIGLVFILVPEFLTKPLVRIIDKHRKDEGDRLKIILERYIVITVLANVFRENGAIMGLVIALLTYETSWCFGLAALAVLMMVKSFPSRSQLEELFPELKRI